MDHICLARWPTPWQNLENPGLSPTTQHIPRKGTRFQEDTLSLGFLRSEANPKLLLRCARPYWLGNRIPKKARFIIAKAMMKAGDNSSDAMSPAERIFPATVLDAGYFVVKFLGQLTSLAACYLEILTFVAD